MTAWPESSAKYQAALQLILSAMPLLSEAAEDIARAVGAPFLESHFFVGSTKWGIRLNKVAYCSNTELRRVADNPRGYVDDRRAVAKILQEGFKICSHRAPQHFLSKLGVSGSSYGPAWWKFWSKSPELEVASRSPAPLPAGPRPTTPGDFREVATTMHVVQEEYNAARMAEVRAAERRAATEAKMNALREEYNGVRLAALETQMKEAERKKIQLRREIMSMKGAKKEKMAC